MVCKLCRRFVLIVWYILKLLGVSLRTVNGNHMESWEIEFEWLHIRNKLKDLFLCDKLPDLNAVLLMVGMQELGYNPGELTKEVKQDLMHVGVCTLLCLEDYYALDGHDSDGWPHYKPLQKIDVLGEKAQESLLVRCAVKYFKSYFSNTNITVA